MSYHRRKPKVIIIRRHCVTGKVVWVYGSQSEEGARLAYWKARRHEVALERRWPRVMARRAKKIQRLIDECVAAMPILGELTDAQRKAIRTLRQMAEQPPKFYRAFYNHLRTERRRRKHDGEIRQQMREREAQRQASENLI